MDLVKLERLAAAGINLLPLPELGAHFVFERDGFVALVERRGEEFGRVGAAGLLVEKDGFAALVWQGNQPFFQSRNYHEAATPQQVATLRGFQSDLEAALSISRR
jgi:hypothetical protein